MCFYSEDNQKDAGDAHFSRYSLLSLCNYLIMHSSNEKSEHLH